MQVQPNIDRFNKSTLLIFDDRLQAFPVPVNLDTEKIAKETLPHNTGFDESFKGIEPVYHAIKFLSKEGFIEYGNSTTDGKAFIQVRLTMKSLSLLEQTPSALEAQQSIGDKIRAIVKGGIREASSEAAKKVVGLVFTHASVLFAAGQAADM